MRVTLKPMVQIWLAAAPQEDWDFPGPALLEEGKYETAHALRC